MDFSKRKKEIAALMADADKEMASAQNEGQIKALNQYRSALELELSGIEGYEIHAPGRKAEE